MLTRCPACTTVYRVTAEQIKARQGKVRCGHCQTIFDALENIVELQRSNPQPKPADPQTPLPAAPPFEALSRTNAEAPGRPARVAVSAAIAAETGPATPPAANVQDEPSLNFSPTSATSGAVAAPATGTRPAGKQLADIESPVSDLPPDPEELTPSRWSMPEGAGEHRHDPFLDTLPDPFDPPRPQAGPALLPPQPHLEPEAVAATLSDDLAPPRKRGSTVVWVILSFILTLVLLGQAALHYRAELASRYPPLKPLLTEMCALAGCFIELPRNPEYITLEGQTLQADPGQAGVFLLSLTLTNRATTPQAYPHLELTLKNSLGEALVKKVFAPGEYLMPPSNAEAGIAAGADMTVTLRFEAKDTPATDFAVSAFYP